LSPIKAQNEEMAGEAGGRETRTRSKIESSKLTGAPGLKRTSSKVHNLEKLRLRSAGITNQTATNQSFPPLKPVKTKFQTNLQISNSKTVITLSDYLETLKTVYNATDDAPIAKFLYKPFTPLPDLAPYLNKFIEVRVHKCYATRHNKAFRHRLFYGSDQYTSDSDIVCILQHTG
jgi:hypothetical protein